LQFGPGRQLGISLLSFGSERFCPLSLSLLSFGSERFCPLSLSPLSFCPERFCQLSLSPLSFCPERFRPYCFCPQSFSPLRISLAGCGQLIVCRADVVIVDSVGIVYIRIRNRWNPDSSYLGAGGVDRRFNASIRLLSGRLRRLR